MGGYLANQGGSGFLGAILAGFVAGYLALLLQKLLRIIPANVAGAALSGALSMYFGCSVMAPSGGVFIIPLNSHPLIYILALLAGIAAGVLLLGILIQGRPNVPSADSTDSN